MDLVNEDDYHDQGNKQLLAARNTLLYMRR